MTISVNRREQWPEVMISNNERTRKPTAISNTLPFVLDRTAKVVTVLNASLGTTPTKILNPPTITDDQNVGFSRRIEVLNMHSSQRVALFFLPNQDATTPVFTANGTVATDGQIIMPNERKSLKFDGSFVMWMVAEGASTGVQIVIDDV